MFNKSIDSDTGFVSNPYEDLGNAIIAQAYNDYIDLWFSAYDKVYTDNSKVIDIKHKGECATNNLVEIREFFNNSLYELITDIPKDRMMRMINNEIKLIEESLEKGLTFEQFYLMNHKKRTSTDKYSYNRFKSSYRENRYFDRIIDEFLKKYDNLSPYQEEKLKDVLTNKNRCFNIVDRLPSFGGSSSHVIYISKADKYKFFIADLNTKCFKRVFSPVTKRTAVAFQPK